MLKPDDQLELTEAELKVEHTRILSARNPQAPDNLITFDFNKVRFIRNKHVRFHVRSDGDILNAKIIVTSVKVIMPPGIK